MQLSLSATVSAFVFPTVNFLVALGPATGWFGAVSLSLNCLFISATFPVRFLSGLALVNNLLGVFLPV